LSAYRVIRNYTEVLKPSASLLLTFIGVCAAVVAGGGRPPLDKLLLTMITILVASAGANGLTNYLDREVDAKMQRTRHRALPSRRIYPAEKVLPLVIGLTVIGLTLAWFLQSAYRLCFIADVVGTTAALVWRKKATCVFPQGVLAGCAPVVMGWLAIRPTFGWELGLLCALIALWLPLHVWSVMIANREDYISAGLTFFPMSQEVREAVKALLLFSLVLATAAISLYFVGGFALLYLTAASLLSVIMVYASSRLVMASTSQNAWRLYKFSAYPYLGVIFLTMCLDIWLR
jgi:protoheme IX farnesyltransferase